jgi:competence protein ComEC
VFGAILAERAPISLRTFAIAMLAVVLIQPESVVTPGFQMSFAATGALVTAYEVWRLKRSGQQTVLGPIATGWASIFVTSLAAGLATTPYILFHFDRATPIGFVANLVASPIVTFLSAPSAALALILAPFGQVELGLRLFGYSLELLLEVAHFFAQFSYEPGTSDRPMPLGSMLLATFAIMGFMATSGAHAHHQLRRAYGRISHVVVCGPALRGPLVCVGRSVRRARRRRYPFATRRWRRPATASLL